jgi:outer membrane protein OmpA-like peptidoglycan-associated protein
MRHLTATAALLLLMTLSGCASWPETGQGGMAEHNLEQLVAMQPRAQVTQEPDTLPASGLTLEYELASRHLDVLVLEGAELCFPATVVQANQRQNRIARELQGGLVMDAANDLLIQRELLNRLERQLDYVRRHDVCRPTIAAGEAIPGDMARQIGDLLNSDNQFVTGSSDLNPKYIGRLAEAAQLLSGSGYHMQITGHADERGNDEMNRALSLARARMVARYLQIFGIPAEQIQVNAVGSNDPLFEGKEPEVMLTNRRVTVELLEAAIPELIASSQTIPIKE